MPVASSGASDGAVGAAAPKHTHEDGSHEEHAVMRLTVIPHRHTKVGGRAAPGLLLGGLAFTPVGPSSPSVRHQSPTHTQ